MLTIKELANKWVVKYAETVMSDEEITEFIKDCDTYGYSTPDVFAEMDKIFMERY